MVSGTGHLKHIVSVSHNMPVFQITFKARVQAKSFDGPLNALPFILLGQVASFLGFSTWDPPLIWNTALCPSWGRSSSLTAADTLDRASFFVLGGNDLIITMDHFFKVFEISLLISLMPDFVTSRRRHCATVSEWYMSLVCDTKLLMLFPTTLLRQEPRHDGITRGHGSHK